MALRMTQKNPLESPTQIHAAIAPLPNKKIPNSKIVRLCDMI